MPTDHTSPGLLLDVKPPGRSPWSGEWLKAPGDAEAHYFLSGARRCLCGAHARRRRSAPLAPGVRRGRYRGYGWAKHVPHCGRCRARNFARWAAAGVAPNGGA